MNFLRRRFGKDVKSPEKEERQEQLNKVQSRQQRRDRIEGSDANSNISTPIKQETDNTKSDDAINVNKESLMYYFSQVILIGTNIINDIMPHCLKFYYEGLKIWKSLEPYHLDRLFPTLFGFILCFFGGSFATVIAAIEAYRINGYQTSLDAVTSIYEDIQKFIEASLKDDQKDEDNDGIPDVQQIDVKALLNRKGFLFLKTIDPNKMGLAITGLQAGLLAVVATLKVRMAKTLTLGVSIANMAERLVDEHCTAGFEAGFDKEYKPWARPILHTGVKILSVSMAWWLQRLISAVHSAMRGGLMVGRNILHYLNSLKMTNIDHETTNIDEIIGYTIAAMGLYYQLSYSFTLSFPLNLVLFPFTILEWALMWLVNMS